MGSVSRLSLSKLGGEVLLGCLDACQRTARQSGEWPVRVAVTAGHSRSLHTIALMHGLHQRGHVVALALETNVLDKKRVRYFVRQLGWRGLARKLVHRGYA